MAALQLSSVALSSPSPTSSPSPSSSISLNFNCIANTRRALKFSKPLRGRRGVVRAVNTDPDNQSEASIEAVKPPSVGLVFVASVMMPDNTPDVQFRKTCGGLNLRNIMMDANVELYGPYARPLLNCAGAGICATCMVEVVSGKELLNQRTNREKEKLKKKPKNYRLACQTTVAKPTDSDGVVIIQQLPEWKAHEWTYEKLKPSDFGL